MNQNKGTFKVTILCKYFNEWKLFGWHTYSCCMASAGLVTQLSEDLRGVEWELEGESGGRRRQCGDM